ncbi:hypothetical protein OEZ86_009140 [Tetradesmus obliquus]|nr:hypothetical protein OEZ86_009140 [Tetradesmus obliquus]
MGLPDADMDVAISDVVASKDDYSHDQNVQKLEAVDMDMDLLLNRNNAEIRQYPDWSRGSGESWSHFVLRLGTEGHTFFDAWLLAAGCIGQVMMTTPNAWHKTGLIPGALIIVWGTIIGFYTMWQLKAMYYDRKKQLIEQGKWFDDPDKPHMRKHKTQMQELLGFYLGPTGGKVVMCMMFFSWFGLGVAQILASSTNYYSIDQSHSLRTYTIIFGATLLPFGLIPSFRKMRLILVIGVLGTLYTSMFGLYLAAHKGFAEAPSAKLLPEPSGVQSFQTFFNGMAIIFAILDHHNIFGETIEAMQHPRKYFKSYVLGFFPLFFMIVPPGIVLNLAFAKSGIATAGNWFQLAPLSVPKKIAVWLMILHNVQAWVLWMTAFGFMWEKMVGTHEKALWIRLTSRLPYLLAVYLFAICFPFYSAINSLMTGLTSPLIYYTIPCITFLIHYRHQENRDKCPYQLARTIFKVVGWRTIMLLDIALALYGIVLCACTSSMAILNLVKLSNTFGFFPECYGCKAYLPAVPKLL